MGKNPTDPSRTSRSQYGENRLKPCPRSPAGLKVRIIAGLSLWESRISEVDRPVCTVPATRAARLFVGRNNSTLLG